MEIPTKKAQTPSSPGGVCLLQRQLQERKKNGRFYSGFSWPLVSPDLSEPWQVQLVPGKSGLSSQQAPKTFQRHKPQECWHARRDRNIDVKASQVRCLVWLKRSRMGRTRNSRTMVLNLGRGGTLSSRHIWQGLEILLNCQNWEVRLASSG